MRKSRRLSVKKRIKREKIGGRLWESVGERERGVKATFVKRLLSVCLIRRWIHRAIAHWRSWAQNEYSAITRRTSLFHRVPFAHSCGRGARSISLLLFTRLHTRASLFSYPSQLNYHRCVPLFRFLLLAAYISE